MQSSSFEDVKALGIMAIQQSLHSRSPSSCRSISPHPSTASVCSTPSTTPISPRTESTTAGKNNTWPSWTHALIPIRLIPSRPKINTVIPAPHSKGRASPIQKPEVKVEVEVVTWERIPAPSGSIRHPESFSRPMSSLSQTTSFQTTLSSEQSRPTSSMSQVTCSFDHGSIKSRPSTSMSCESRGSNASENSNASGRAASCRLSMARKLPRLRFQDAIVCLANSIVGVVTVREPCHLEAG